MKYVNLKARAKINTALDVLGKREDGYHELRMIMQTVNLCDNITIMRINEDEIRLTSNFSWLPTDERNLMYRAAELMKQRYDIKDGVEMELVKKIPVAAGLAGGSSDCAAVIVGMNRLFNLKRPTDELLALGKELGADVPYCIMRGTVLAEGIGEKLTRLSPFPSCFVLLCKPNINVSTATVFKSLELDKVTEHPDVDKMIRDIENNDLAAISDGMKNVLETVTIPNYPIIADIKKKMMKLGAVGSMMSGSGPTVFGFFESYESGLIALKTIRRVFHTKEIYLTTVFNEKGTNK
jgi:4-diphosphocytidyl-2-C-methyl-D-erythritol kinase